MDYTSPKLAGVKPTYKRSKVRPHRVQAKDMRQVELVHVGPPASPITHYLIKAGPLYYHANSIDGKVSFMTEEEYTYPYSVLHTELTRTKIKPSSPTASAQRLNDLLAHGWRFNLLTSNCLDFANYVITGNPSTPVLPHLINETNEVLTND